MRSALSVFSWSISAPQALTILSSSVAAAAARHGAGSISKSLAGSTPAAKAPGESATHRTDAKTALVILKQPRIDCLARSFRYRRDRSKQSAVRTAADLQLIASSRPICAIAHQEPGPIRRGLSVRESCSTAFALHKSLWLWVPDRRA